MSAFPLPFEDRERLMDAVVRYDEAAMEFGVALGRGIDPDTTSVRLRKRAAFAVLLGLVYHGRDDVVAIQSLAPDIIPDPVSPALLEPVEVVG